MVLVSMQLGAPTVTLRVAALRRLLAHQGLSAADLARATEVTRGAVDLWLHARRQPRARTRTKILRLLGAEFSDLFHVSNGR